ncbi:facilitated trehalose transporter Tret1-like [Hylaeus anthracinus]|uniref:facilitated trehalose transporter Tret1-like n=1 Tax=Hylaeus anthracinus TaxID=313031 RepID=UPI0023B91F4E|nr:facilitated trehalose transporter Tret1-like [Hylaeus anthracinus]
MTSTSANDNMVEIRKLNQYIGAVIASLGGFALGVALGWNSSAGEVLRNHMDATATEIGVIGGILNAGAGFGAILVPFLARRVRRTTMMIATMPFLAVGWTLICFSGIKVTNNFQTTCLMVGRAICGVCGGIFAVATPTYVAEIADKKIRGRLLGFFQIFVNCGIMYAFVAANAIDEHETVWRYSSICGIACFSIMPTKLLPESPLYYLSRNDEINAEKSLRWYRGDTYDIQHEINEMKQLVIMTRSKKLSLKMLKNRRILRSLATCFGVVLGQQFSGANMMIFYALTLFNTMGSGELTGSEQTLIVGAVQILTSFLAAFLVDVLGRRILLSVSTLLMGLFLILLGWFFSLRDMDPEYDDIYFWMAPTWIILFFASFNLGLGPISWSVLGDVLPAEVRISGAAVALVLGWLVSLLATLTFDEMFVTLGTAKLMWLSAAICWLVSLFCAIVAKDTTGKSLAEVQEDFGIELNRGLEET